MLWWTYKDHYSPNLINILVYSIVKMDVFDFSDILIESKLDLNPLDVISGQDTLISYDLLRE